MRKRMFLMAAIAAIPFFQPASSKATITLFLNEGNCVSGSKYLETSSTGKDTGPLISTVNGGYVQGNGQNWLELVVGAPASGHTVDLRGYQLIWSSQKDANDYSSGVITFNNVTDWSAVPEGTIIGINEWRDVYYNVTGGTADRNGGYDGFGLLHGSASGTHLNLHTDTASFNGSAGNWGVHFFAGDDGTGGGGAVGHNTGSSSYASSYYFTFTGSQTTNGTTAYIGDTNDSSKSAGLFVVNNDNWALTIEDGSNNVVIGNIGEAQPNWVPTGGSKGGVNSQEVLKLQPGAYSSHGYDTITNVDYAGGHESTYMAVNVWNGTGTPESLSSLQSYTPLPTHW